MPMNLNCLNELKITSKLLYDNDDNNNNNNNTLSMWYWMAKLKYVGSNCAIPWNIILLGYKRKII